MALPAGIELSGEQLDAVIARLFAYFSRRLPRDAERVEELVAETIVRVLGDHGSMWEPARGNLTTFAISIVARGVLRDDARARARRARREVIGRNVDVVVEPDEAGIAPVEVRMDEQAALARLASMAAGDREVTLLIGVMRGEVTVDELGLSSRQRHNARRRLKRLIARL